jgi:hypothetical protein
LVVIHLQPISLSENVKETAIPVGFGVKQLPLRTATAPDIIDRDNYSVTPLFSSLSFPDAHCGYGLVCFQKGASKNVPGCSGEDSSKTDFCIKDPNPKSYGANGATVTSVNVISAEEAGNLPAENDVTTPEDEEESEVAAAEIEQKSGSTMLSVYAGMMITLSVFFSLA